MADLADDSRKSGGNRVTHSTSCAPNTARCLQFSECKRTGLEECRRKNKHKCREHGYGKIQRAAGAIDSARVCCCLKRFSTGNVSRHDCTYRHYIPPLHTAATYCRYTPPNASPFHAITGRKTSKQRILGYQRQTSQRSSLSVAQLE